MSTGATPAAAIADEDIYAFSPLPQIPPPPAPRPRRRWPWVLLVCVLAISLLALVGALNLLDHLGSVHDGMGVTINGEDWDPFFVGPEHAVIALLAATAGLFVLLLVLPMVVLLVLVVATLAVALAVGSALLVMLVVAAVALSPLWLLGLLIWLLLRKPGGRTARQAGAG
jgi:hypothetical protein